MSDIAAEAAFLRKALLLGIRDVASVVAWSDSIIGELDEPPEAFIDLSGMSKAHVLDVTHVLESVAAPMSTVELLPRLLADAHDKLRVDPAYGPELARALYQVCLEGTPLPSQFNALYSFADAYDLAKAGTFGSIREVYEELLEFTGRFKK
jgi:hypothetical protein